MKRLLCLLLLACAFTASAAFPPFTAFIGSNAVTVITNPTTGKIIIGVDSSQLEIPGRFSTNRNSAISNLFWGNTVFVDTGGNDATGLRADATKPFLTLTGGKNAAQAGDLVWVRPGIYVNATNLLKQGVRWWFDGPTCSNTSSGAGFAPIFTDNNVGLSNCDVMGYGTFIYDTLTFVAGGPTVPYGNIFQTMNAGTRMKFEFHEMYDFNVDDQYANTIMVSNCNEMVIRGELNDGRNVPEQDVGNGALYYQGGKLDYRVAKTLGDKGGAVRVLPGQAGTNYLTIHGEAWSAHEASIYILAGGSNYFVTINAPQVYGHGSPTMNLYMLSGNVTLNADLMRSRSQTADFNETDGHIYQTGGHLILNAKRFQNSWRAINIKGGTFNINIDDLVDMGGQPNGAITITNAQGSLRVGRSVQTNGWWMTYGGSNVTLNSSYVNMVGSAATNWPIKVLGSGLTLKNTTLVSPAAALSIDAPAAQNVRILGSFANRAPSNNVTVLVGPWTVDTNVQ